MPVKVLQRILTVQTPGEGKGSLARESRRLPDRW